MRDDISALTDGLDLDAILNENEKVRRLLVTTAWDLSHARRDLAAQERRIKALEDSK